MLTMAKFKEWTLVSNKDGNEPQLQGDYWFNQKTGEKTLEHPGKRYYPTNVRAMRKRAEEKFQTDVLDKIESEKITYGE